MKALCWNGKNDIRCESVPDPKIGDARDVILRCCAICGSDLLIRKPYSPEALGSVLNSMLSEARG